MSSTRRWRVSTPLTAIGWREWATFPELGISAIKCKVDTGARTSALHAVDIREFERDGLRMVRFLVHPAQRTRRSVVECEAPVVDRRSVRNSGGLAQQRYVVRTVLALGESRYPIELTLTHRDAMGFRALLGRTALRGRFVVDPARSYLVSVRPPATPGVR